MSHLIVYLRLKRLASLNVFMFFSFNLLFHPILVVFTSLLVTNNGVQLGVQNLVQRAPIHFFFLVS